MDEAQLRKLLQANAQIPFVQRILNPNDSPTLDLGQGVHATHLMATAEVDGKYIAFPTVQMDGEVLKDFGDQALDRALESGDFMEFKTPAQADWFSKNYKNYWK